MDFPLPGTKIGKYIYSPVARRESNLNRLPCIAPVQHNQKSAHFAVRNCCRYMGLNQNQPHFGSSVLSDSLAVSGFISGFGGPSLNCSEKLDRVSCMSGTPDCKSRYHRWHGQNRITLWLMLGNTHDNNSWHECRMCITGWKQLIVVFVEW